MSIQQQRTKQVYDAIREITGNGDSAFRPGDVAGKLRAEGRPLEVWEIRGELSSLEGEGLITFNPESGAWTLAQATAKKQASC
ncbi:MAG: hypothetical protein O7E57_02500 [Gammaproteobacteria bacterium]|nr:hypothetical protein [Gammaproteobacteria bacterium]